MQFLLISPFDYRLTNESAVKVKKHKSVRFVDRDTFDPGMMDREAKTFDDLRRIEIDTTELENSADSEVLTDATILRLELVEVAQIPVLRMIVEFDNIKDKIIHSCATPNSKNIERQTTLAAIIAAKHVAEQQNYRTRDGKLAEILWTNRTAILGDGEAIEGWSMDPAGDRELPSAQEESCKTTVGWGNNTIDQCPSWSGEYTREIAKGITDAQILWTRLMKLNDKLRSEFSTIEESQRSKRKDKPVIAILKEDRTELAILNLIYDDLVTKTQGIRRLAAENCLNSWQYHDYLERVKVRISDFDEISRANSEIIRRKYQSGVETILAVLGSLAIVQTAVDLIGAAYSETGRVAGGEWPSFSVLNLLRAANIDLLVILALVLYIIVFMYFSRANRKGDI
ncbi:hypothetical protein KRX51_08865 [Corynebacterium sp. TAE3-ERU12]|uniref:hypothetical protein n=1 Tax=Corynebacterium sp. TAE3-ERU12 TaxID=2849491 RepID=UPI001C48D0FA|nr:hypothetical protein [Corynebacterium sp. TAE3-ERU12]MBV7296020.1 hypothetical protein [Corynebacterium sp. TAE3-ERU12]